MNSTALVAGSPAQGAEPAARAPTDWRTGAMQNRIRRRYASERRFRLTGLFAVVMSAAFLAFLLITMVGNGLRGFQRTEVTLSIDFARLALPVTREQLAGPGADLALAGAGLQGAVGRAAEQAFGEGGADHIADTAWLRVRDAIKADAALLATRAAISVPASTDIDEAARGTGKPADEADREGGPDVGRKGEREIAAEGASDGREQQRLAADPVAE